MNTKRKYLIIQVLTALAIITCLTPSIVYGSVYFIEKPGDEGRNTTPRPCIERGYTITTCPDNKIPVLQCNTGEPFFRRCACDSEIYKYDKYNCPGNQKPTGKSCNDKYDSCDCDTSVYKYATNGGIKCPEPQSPSGDFCTSNRGIRLYSSCECPNTHKTECQYPLVGKGIGCNNKYESCECSSEFNLCKHGGRGGSCTDSEGTKYRDCLPLQCGDGYVNVDSYWCNKALRCYSPASN